jgi:hypothetical protein
MLKFRGTGQYGVTVLAVVVTELEVMKLCVNPIYTSGIKLKHISSIQYTRIKETSVKYLCYTRKNAQVVINLQQTCSNAVPTTCQQDVFALLAPSLLTTQLATRLLNSTDL